MKYNNENNNKLKEHLKYVEKLQKNEFLELLKRYKKSLNKIHNEEISHIKNYVFPKNVIDYLIKVKNEFTIDKFRIEYLNKISRYKVSNFLRNLKYHKSIDNQNRKNIKKGTTVKIIEMNKTNTDN